MQLRLVLDLADALAQVQKELAALSLSLLAVSLLFRNLSSIKKSIETTIFLLESGFCCKATKKLLLLDGENKKTLIGHIRVLWSKMVLFEKQKGDVSKTTIFLQVLVANTLDFVTLSFCLLAFPL